MRRERTSSISILTKQCRLPLRGVRLLHPLGDFADALLNFDCDTLRIDVLRQKVLTIKGLMQLINMEETHDELRQSHCVKINRLQFRAART
jgi:hypothetical protein